MSELGTVHVLITGEHRVYDDTVPYPDGGALGLRQEEDGPVTVISGADDWWWEVDPDQLPEWARGQAEVFADRVRRP